MVGVELREGKAGVVVDADKEVFPAGAGAGVAPVPGEAVTGAVKAAEFLDIKVQQVARAGMFVAADGWRRVEGTEAGKALAAEDPTDGSRRHPDSGGDLCAGPAQPAQGGDAADDGGRYRPWRAMRTRAAVEQAVGALGPIAVYPLAHGVRTDPEDVGHRLRGLALVEDPPDNSGSTLRGQLGILMDVHSVLLPGNCVLGTLSFLGRDRVNNLLKDHS